MNFTEVLKTLTKVGTMLTVSRFLNGEAFDKEWMNSTLFTLVGFVVSGIIVQLLDTQIKQYDNYIGSSVIGDIVGVPITLMIARLLSGKPIDITFIMSVIFTVIGFSVYNLVINNSIKSIKIGQETVTGLLSDVFKPATMLVISQVLSGGTINSKLVRNIIFTVTGFMAFHATGKRLF